MKSVDSTLNTFKNRSIVLLLKNHRMIENDSMNYDRAS